MKLFKKLDLIIIFSLIALSFTPYIILSKFLHKNNTSTYASIKIDGKFYKDIPFSTDNNEKQFIIETPEGYNTLVVKNNSIKVISSDCHDDICVKQGDISKVGQSIICLPHKLIIEIKGDSDSSEDDFILSH